MSSLVLWTVGAAFVAAVVVMVAGSLHRPEMPTYIPSPVNPREVDEETVGATLYTVDARLHDEWTYFDFSRGSVVPVESRWSLDWDLAFQRHRILTNGGDTNPRGRGGVLDLGPVPIDSVWEVPEGGYVTDVRRGDQPRNPVLEDWYDYSWTSHLLRPADRSYAVRTADGRYAVLRFLGYYCPGGVPGCVTFVYRYRGDGTRFWTASSNDEVRRSKIEVGGAGVGERAASDDDAALPGTRTEGW